MINMVFPPANGRSIYAVRRKNNTVVVTKEDGNPCFSGKAPYVSPKATTQKWEETWLRWIAEMLDPELTKEADTLRRRPFRLAAYIDIVARNLYKIPNV